MDDIAPLMRGFALLGTYQGLLEAQRGGWKGIDAGLQGILEYDYEQKESGND